MELDHSEFSYAPKDLSDDTKEVMNDGYGQLLKKMSINIVQCLGLSHLLSCLKLGSEVQKDSGSLMSMMIMDTRVRKEISRLEVST